MNRRLIGFNPSSQAYSIPVHTIQVASGSTSATISPGVGGLFTKTGPINPHQVSTQVIKIEEWSCPPQYDALQYLELMEHTAREQTLFMRDMPQYLGHLIILFVKPSYHVYDVMLPV